MEQILGDVRVTPLNQEVLVAGDPVVKLSRADIQVLKDWALRNPRQRIRICAHKDTKDRLHEMLIVHTRNTYVRPHKNLNKSESFHVIEGAVDVVIFDEQGSVTELIRMGDYASGRRFYYRIEQPAYHTLLITSDVLVFHETTNGPFRREETIFAPWAPEEQDEAARAGFLARLQEEVKG